MVRMDGFQDSNSKPRKLSSVAESLVRSECVSPVYLLKKSGTFFGKGLDKIYRCVKLTYTTMWELI
jgi:hypothetical protein